MAFEISEIDGNIGITIIRLVCGLIGIVGIVILSDGFISWLSDSSAYASIWDALIGDEPYCSLAFGRSVRLGGGFLWKMTPNGMLPAICAISLSCSALIAAIFNRLWMYCIIMPLIITASI